MSYLLKSNLVRLLCLALAYFLLARLGLLLAIPPGYATAIWPASGLAIAALLLWGYPMAIGVFIGSLAVNASVSAIPAPLNLANLYLPAAIASGSALQAVVGKYLVERYCAAPWTFHRLSQTLLLIGLGGLLASLVSASVGSLSLLTFGIIDHAAFADSWFTWWLGDSLGIIVFAPLILIAQEDNALVSRRRKLIVVLPMVVVFSSIGYLYNANKQDIRDRLQSQLQQEAGLAGAFLQQLIAQKTSVLHGAAGLFRASDHVNREEFFRFYESLSAAMPGLKALSWSPRITRNEIPGLLSSAAREGYSGYQLRQMSTDGLTPVEPRQQYQPIFHLAPLETHARALGFDLLSETRRHDAINKALASTDMAAAGPVELVHSDKVERAYLLVLPVSPEQNQDVVIAVISLENMIAPFQRLRMDKAVEFRLREESSGELLYQSAERETSLGEFQHFTRLPFVDREWNLEVWLPDAAVARAMTDRLWPIIVGGFCIIASLTLLIINSTGAQASAASAVKRKTAELEQERSFLETLIDHLPLILYVKDAESRRYIRANQAASKVLGEAHTDLINRTQDELFAEGMGYSSREADDTVVFEKQVHHETTRFEHDGSVYWFSGRKIPIEDPATGKVKYILGLAEDITAHRNAERSLEDSRQRISRILENVGEGIYGVDADGYLTFVNHASTELLGYTEQEVLGQHEHSLFHHHHRNGQTFSPDECSIRQTLLTGKSYRVDDEVFWKKDGAAVAVEYVSTPIIEDQRVIGAVVVFSDISKRQVMERLQQEQTSRVEQINQELEEFSYVASHDIQEPLRTLNCFCDFLVEDLGEDLPERAATDLGYIKEASQRMSVLINDMLEYSRAGRNDLELVPIELDECLHQIQDDLQLLIRESGATLTVEPLPRVIGDANSLVRIFQNLIQNGIKFCKDRPPVVTVKEVENDGHTATIVVSDNGIGIEPRFINQIFGAFRRLHNSEDYPGSGIGLAVVKKLVERHEGKIRVESAPGEGSHFYVSLPLRPSYEQP